MKSMQLPSADHVARYVPKRCLLDSGRVDGLAFCLRPKEIGLSVSWLEGTGRMTKASQMDEVRRLTPLTMRPSARFAELNVGTTKRSLATAGRSLEIVHPPLSYNPAHSEIRGLPESESPEAALVGDLIASCVTALHPAVPPIRAARGERPDKS